MTALAPILQAYFTERLARRQASPHTVASYRDTFCLLLRFAQQHLGKPTSTLGTRAAKALLGTSFRLTQHRGEVLRHAGLRW